MLVICILLAITIWIVKERKESVMTSVILAQASEKRELPLLEMGRMREEHFSMFYQSSCFGSIKVELSLGYSGCDKRKAVVYISLVQRKGSE